MRSTRVIPGSEWQGPLMALMAWILTVCAPAGAAALAPGSGPVMQVDWASFLHKHDLVWEQLPEQWNEGAFLGNGKLGMMVYATRADNRIDFHLGRTDATDHRKAPDRQTSIWTPGTTPHYDYPRLDLGRMALHPAGRILSGTMRVSLWDAELTATIVTDRGELRLRAVTSHEEMVDRIEVESTETTADGQPAPWRWELLPGNPIAPRRLVFPNDAGRIGYVTNPPPTCKLGAVVKSCVQSLLAGGDYATAWTEVATGTAGGSVRGLLLVTTANRVPAAGRSGPEALRTIETARREDAGRFLSRHRAWWHAYYPQSFLTIPDARLESFYWIQMYKLGSAIRAGGDVLDDSGPFFRVNQWPYPTWNLNVQLSYWPVYAANRLELGSTLTAVMDANFERMLRAFDWSGPAGGSPVGTGVGGASHQSTNFGDLVWAVHNYWWQARFAGDDTLLRRGWMPKAAAVANAYLARLAPGADGKLHLPPMQSPEYPGPPGLYPDTNYNLALCRWVLRTLIETSARLHLVPPSLGLWKDALARLTPFVEGPDGLEIGAGQPLAISHRHFSHLLALYPLFDLDPDSPADRALVERSVDHWHDVEHGRLLAGYSFTGGAALYAAMGEGDRANAMLQDFLRGKVGAAVFLPNTMYVESNGKNPTIETPLAGASAVQDMLLQSWGGRLRVFPAVPSAWQEAEFHDLRGLGAFLVTARRVDGRTAWVSVKSLKGESCRLQVSDFNGDLQIAGGGTLPAHAPGRYILHLKAGEEITLWPRRGSEKALLEPLPHDPSTWNSFGLKRGQQLAPGQTWPDQIP